MSLHTALVSPLPLTSQLGPYNQMLIFSWSSAGVVAVEDISAGFCVPAQFFQCFAGTSLLISLTISTNCFYSLSSSLSQQRTIYVAIVLLILWSNFIETNVSAAIQLPSSVENMTMTKWTSIYSMENGRGIIIVWMKWMWHDNCSMTLNGDWNSESKNIEERWQLQTLSCQRWLNTHEPTSTQLTGGM